MACGPVRLASNKVGCCSSAGGPIGTAGLGAGGGCGVGLGLGWGYGAAWGSKYLVIDPEFESQDKRPQWLRQLQVQAAGAGYCMGMGRTYAPANKSAACSNPWAPVYPAFQPSHHYPLQWETHRTGLSTAATMSTRDVGRIDMKTFAFVYMLNERDAERAIRKLDGKECGFKRRPLRVQWAKTKDADRKRNARPSTTLFVVNFDLSRTRERDVERHFEQYGRIKRLLQLCSKSFLGSCFRMEGMRCSLHVPVHEPGLRAVCACMQSYAFVQFEQLEDAEYAMKRSNGTQLLGRTVTVEYVQNENPNAARERGFPDPVSRDVYYGDRSRDSPHRSRERSPVGRGSPRDRSPPLRRSRSRSPLPASRGRSPLPLSRGRSPLPTSRGRSPLPASRGRSPLPVSRGRSRSPRSRSPRSRDYSR
ncbi:hypothetical protein QJQ45_014534 [Haematococcus lacustris]|nr:hypothetical protein QJQ45_014534 [Haematococcus lacustris]